MPVTQAPWPAWVTIHSSGGGSTGRRESLAIMWVCWEKWHACVPGVAGDSTWLKGIEYFVWEGLWLKNAINFVLSFRVGYKLQLRTSINYGILVINHSRADHYCLIDNPWCRNDSAEEKWRMGSKRRNKKKMQLCLLLGHVWLLQVLEAASTWCKWEQPQDHLAPALCVLSQVNTRESLSWCSNFYSIRTK